MTWETAVFGFVAILLIAHSSIAVVFFRHLRTRAPQTWRELGSPGVDVRAGVQPTMNAVRFVWKNEHRSLPLALRRQAEAFKWTSLVLPAGFLGALALILINGGGRSAWTCSGVECVEILYLLVYAVVILIWAIAHFRVRVHLKRSDPEMWRRIGSPEVWETSSATTYRVFSALRKGEHRRSTDGRIRRWGTVFYWASWAFFVLFVGGFVLLAITAPLKG